MSVNYTPKTFEAGAPLLAADLNTEVRDLSAGLQGPWLTWAPAFTGLTVGNGTTTARYHQVGKTVSYRLIFTAGTTTTFSAAFTFSLPVTIRNDYPAGLESIGSAFYVDAAAAGSRTIGGVYVSSAGSSLAGMIVERIGGTYATAALVNSTTPWTWAADDSFSATGTYEAA